MLLGSLPLDRTVELGKGRGEPLPCHPSHALQDKLREDEEYVGLRCQVVDGEVVTLVDKASSIQPSAFQAPLFVGYLAATSRSRPATRRSSTGFRRCSAEGCSTTARSTRGRPDSRLLRGV